MDKEHPDYRLAEFIAVSGMDDDFSPSRYKADAKLLAAIPEIRARVLAERPAATAELTDEEIASLQTAYNVGYRGNSMQARKTEGWRAAIARFLELRAMPEKPADVPDPGPDHRLLRKGATPEMLLEGDGLWFGHIGHDEWVEQVGFTSLPQTPDRWYRRRIVPAPAIPAYFVTAERRPTQEDATAGGYVDAADYGDGGYVMMQWYDALGYDVWKKREVPPPVSVEASAEEKARKAAYDARFNDPSEPPSATEIGSFNAAWEAAKEFFTSQQKSD